MNEKLEALATAVENASAMHWDGCHKIYLSMDEATVDQMREYGYDVEPPDFDIIMSWFAESCGLRFIEAVYFPNNFVSMIPQFDEDFTEYDDEVDNEG